MISGMSYDILIAAIPLDYSINPLKCVPFGSCCASSSVLRADATEWLDEAALINQPASSSVLRADATEWPFLIRLNWVGMVEV
jgi:hypothetical protein